MRWEWGALEIAIVLVVLLWALGWLALPAAGGLIHVLLVVVLVLVIVRFLQGRW